MNDDQKKRLRRIAETVLILATGVVLGAAVLIGVYELAVGLAEATG